jgi:hypothetical protein
VPGGHFSGDFSFALEVVSILPKKNDLPAVVQRAL